MAYYSDAHSQYSIDICGVKRVYLRSDPHDM